MATSITMNGMPFDSKLVNGQYDRERYAADFAQYFGSVFSTGIFPNKTGDNQYSLGEQLLVKKVGSNLEVRPGACIINGRIAWITEAISLTPEANVGGNRLDTVVAELDISQEVRAFNLKWIKGDGSSVRKDPVRLGNIYQLLLAEVPWTGSSMSEPRDKRTDAEWCGSATVILPPKTIGNVDIIQLVDTEPTDEVSRQSPRTLFMWGE